MRLQTASFLTALIISLAPFYAISSDIIEFNTFREDAQPGSYILHVSKQDSAGAAEDTEAESCLKILPGSAMGTPTTNAAISTFGQAIEIKKSDIEQSSIFRLYLRLENQCNREFKSYFAAWNSTHKDYWVGDWQTIPANGQVDVY
ncbi:hypothetical protein [Pantoea agglomerans]|uniref:hypothetical protein n=1 Tax=Enterobacter agglomerans TaxID=549 RepID=UPI00241327EF|nr:hypothetical protein [Pantoea agglomerans]